ncbi:MAG: DeoR family transcriptional regulator [Candidatus Pacebacteria bacterium]|nr:DeoR family transcriptional regulator [Candidatus Paceibacterota bacterium]
MDKERIIGLINELYRITSLFPKKEPLRYKMREAADNLLLHFTTFESLNSNNPGSFAGDVKMKTKECLFEIENNFEIINNYFNVTKWQNWASYFNIIALQEKYDLFKKDVKEEIKRIVLEKKITVEKEDKPEKNNHSLSIREKKIMLLLKDKGRAQVNDASKMLPSVAKRTLRRDFLALIEKGLIERMGENNNTYYSLKE